MSLGQAVLRPAESAKAPQPVTRVVLVGTLNDVQGIAGSEVLHLMWADRSQVLEQSELRQMVRRRVIVTVEISPNDPGVAQQ